MSQQKETERVREIFDASAAQYDKGMAFTEKLFFGDGRAWACCQARGQVLEIAIGTGRNLPFYQADVEITGIEISPAMLEIARQRAQSLGRQAKLVVGVGYDILAGRNPVENSVKRNWCVEGNDNIGILGGPDGDAGRRESVFAYGAFVFNTPSQCVAVVSKELTVSLPVAPNRLASSPVRFQAMSTSPACNAAVSDAISGIVRNTTWPIAGFLPQ